MKKIQYKGEEHEAFDFLMKKENALEILSGNKKIETRCYSDYYYRLVSDKNDKDKPVRDDISFIYFHNYNNTWYLIVRIKEFGISNLSKKEVENIAKEFDFHDNDNEWQKYSHLPDDEKPAFYWFAISEIVSHNLIP
jgi:hypothetical protein